MRGSSGKGLRFQSGQSIRIHSQKMALASSVLQALLDDVMDEQITSAKRKRAADSEGASSEHVPSLQVSRMGTGASEVRRAGSKKGWLGFLQPVNLNPWVVR